MGWCAVGCRLTKKMMGSIKDSAVFSSFDPYRARVRKLPSRSARVRITSA